ncbi:hypothetical protein HRbin16_00701 [bacterium HR16]|nr:hypothetical protein HRbin16_00701 [bacterium HR16]
MKDKLFRASPKVMVWLSGLVGLIGGFKIYSWINPRFHSPFFHNAWGMAFVVLVYTFLYVTLGPRLQKQVEQPMSGRGGRAAE